MTRTPARQRISAAYNDFYAIRPTIFTSARCLITIRYLYFDLGNVLFHFSHERMISQMAELAGVETDLVQRVLFADGLQHRFERGGCDRRSFYSQFCEATCSQPEFTALEAAGSDIFAVNQPMLPLVERLAGLGLGLGVLSNTCESHWLHLNDGRFGVLPGPFQATVLSYRERSMKPEREIYEAAILRTGLTADEIFFVDDRPENVAGARAAGIDAVQFVGVERLAESLRGRGVDC